jgi:uncharacterized protein (DUF58 family)
MTAAPAPSLSAPPRVQAGARALAGLRGAGERLGALGSRAGRIARPLRIGTPLGWALAAVAALAAVLGLTFGWAEFLAIAVAVVILIVSAVPFVVGRTQYAVRVELASPRVVVGASAVGRLVVRNVARGVSPAAWLLLPVGAVRARFRMPRLAHNAEHEDLFQVPTNRRAVLTVGPATSLRSDPLGLLRREMSWTEPVELYVHPRTVVLDGDTTGLVRDLEGLPTQQLADDDISFHALREYSPGDDLRYVHWKSTARTQKTMIRQFEQTRRSQLVVALSTREDEYAGEEDFELAVSVAASVAASAMRDGKDVTLLTSSEVFAEPTPMRLLDRLSAVERTGSAPGIESLGRSVAAKTPGASVVTFVTGAMTEVTRLNAASVRVPVTARAAGLRVLPGERLARHLIGGFATVDVPDLASLRAAIRAVSS